MQRSRSGDLPGFPTIFAGLVIEPRVLFCLLGLLVCWHPAWADNMAEYRLKAVFLYNFVSFTEWPDDLGTTLNLCVYGPDPFGEDLDKLQAKTVAGRSLAVRRINSVDALEGCQIVFISRAVIGNLPRVLDKLSGKQTLTVADSPGAGRQGVALNMFTEENKILFEANPGAAHGNRLVLSSKLLRLAKEVHQ
jgi:hypothetical protein